MQNQIFKDSIQELEKLKSFIGQMDTETYQRRDEFWDKNSIGAHIRHVLEFYSCFFKGLKNGRIDYNSRARNPKLEESPDEAVLLINLLLESLKNLAPKPNLKVCSQHNLINIQSEHQSNIDRELAFLIDHSVHHLSIIRFMLKSYNLESTINGDFGYAYSTIEYHKRK